MRLESFFCSLISYISMIAGSILCYAPMMNSLKFSKKQLNFCMAVVIAVIFPFAAYLEYRFGLSYDDLYIPMIIILFSFYHLSLKTPVFQSLGIFMFVYTLLSFMYNLSVVYDAVIHPLSDLEHFSVEASVVQLILYFLMCLIFIYPLKKYGTFLIDNLPDPVIWLVTVFISAIFLIYNLTLTINYYSTLYTNKVMFAYIFSFFLMLGFYILFSVLFYLVVSYLLKQGAKNEKLRILEMQEKQFLFQQDYLNASAQVRHDFKHVIRTLTLLLHEKDYDGIDSFLSEYTESIPENEITNYCSDNAVNAMVNYYVLQAESENISLDIKIDLPDKLLIKNIDICSILGNILENAISACKNVPVEKRAIKLSLISVNEDEIYIASSNIFNGIIKKNGDRFISTKESGKGIGLISVMSIAEKYGGFARFSYNEERFRSDVFLRNK